MKAKNFAMHRSGRITSLELVRGLSALVVMLGHLRSALLPDFGDLISPTVLTKIFYFVSGMGHQAVMVFFVLSGYFVGGAVLRQAGGFYVLDYVVARLSRLWVVLLPALLLTWALDTALLSFWPHVLDAAHIESWRCIPHDGLLQHGWVVFIGNAMFLQTVSVPIFGSNGPLWSLAYEAWYYLLFPLIWHGVVRSARWTHKLLFLIVSAAVLSAMTQEMRWLFIAWVMGAAVHGVPGRWHCFGRWTCGTLSLVWMLVMLSLARLDKVPSLFPFAHDLLLAAAVSMWCLHVRFAETLAWPDWLRAPTHRLSDMSFSLYLIHMPIIFVGVGALIPSGKMSLNASGWVTFAALSLGIVATSWLFWWMFERHAPEVRKLLMQGLLRLMERLALKAAREPQKGA
ncbi:MAG: acyltransferase [Proteobacteria bacterium]|uniref:acyltransferase family protein n=1 Tax=Aquabacterium sp. TaxID=1872578 RepID=UPI0035C6F1EE|nr:acyltransferase [Pseudomonadota bacterium]